MKIILTAILTLSLNIAFAQQKKNESNVVDTLSNLQWNGKSISRRALDDSIRVLFFKIHDSIENDKLKNKELHYLIQDKNRFLKRSTKLKLNYFSN